MDQDFHDAHEAFRQRFRALATELQQLHAAWEAAVEAHDIPRQSVLIAREHELLTAVSEVIAAFQAIISQQPAVARCYGGSTAPRRGHGSREAPAVQPMAIVHHPTHRTPAAGACPALCEETLMSSYASSDLVWDTTEPKAPRWVLVLDGPPGAARRRVDPHDPATPQAASTSQLRELIHQAFHADTGHWPVSVTLAAVRYKQRFRFHVVTH